MLSQSLLVTLGSLRRLEKKVFIAENFLTAIFAFLLKNDRTLLRAYLKHLGLHVSKLPEVQIQKNYGEASNKNIPDMVLSEKSMILTGRSSIPLMAFGLDRSRGM